MKHYQPAITGRGREEADTVKRPLGYLFQLEEKTRIFMECHKYDYTYYYRF